MRITVLHPDLGIGGAERLVLDVVAAYKSAGHDVSIVTNHFSPTHCFDDALLYKDGAFFNGFEMSHCCPF